MRSLLGAGCITIAMAASACGDSTTITGSGGTPGASSSSSSGAGTGGSTTSSGGSGGMSNGGNGGSSAGGNGSGGGGGASAGQWRADAWPGGLDHIVVSYQDDANSRCFRIQADYPTMGSLNVTIPNGWGVNSITAWDSTTNCLDWQQTPAGQSDYAASATGSIAFMGTGMSVYPCEIDVAIVANFTNPPAWLAPNITLNTSNLTVQGACP